MRAPHQLVHSRARVRSRYAVLPSEGIPASRLPEWPDALAYVLAAPSLGADFTEYRIDLEPGQTGRHAGDGRIEHFLFVVEGELSLRLDKRVHSLKTDGFALLPPGCDYEVGAQAATRLLLLRKVYEPLPGMEPFQPRLGSAAHVAGEPFLGDPGAQLQVLVPDRLEFDLAMNIFTFQAGHSLPFVETHVMEHGLCFLQGKGLYYLDDTWMEVEAGDFIWMGPYCPQCFYATGPVASKYLYYKNVNRDIRLGT